MALPKKSISEIKSLYQGTPTEDGTAKLKSDWNLFVDYMQKNGAKGHPDLDKGVGKNNMGIRYLEQYRKENPSTSLTPENVSEVQKNFQNYRDFAINEIKNKRATYDGDISKIDTPQSDFMKDLSIVDGIPGSRTTSHQFPSSFLTTIYKSPTGQVENKNTVNQGLASIK